jgi:predicted XRE-type DNA-binding protein
MGDDHSASRRQERQALVLRGQQRIADRWNLVGRQLQDHGTRTESEHLLVRADLLIQLQKAIASSGLKQAETAKVCASRGPG